MAADAPVDKSLARRKVSRLIDISPTAVQRGTFETGDAPDKRWKYFLGRRVVRLRDVAYISLGLLPQHGPSEFTEAEELKERIADLCGWLAPAFSVNGNVLLVEHENNELERSIECYYVDAWVGLQLLHEKYPQQSRATQEFLASITSSPLGFDSGVAGRGDIKRAEVPGDGPGKGFEVADTASKLLVALVEEHLGRVEPSSVLRLSTALIKMIRSSRHSDLDVDPIIAKMLLIRGMATKR